MDVLNQLKLKELFYSAEMRDIRARHYQTAYEQGRFDEYAESTYGKYTSLNGSVKPIRPTVVNIESDEEYDYIASTKRDNSEGLESVRELMRIHRRLKKSD